MPIVEHTIPHMDGHLYDISSFKAMQPNITDKTHGNIPIKIHDRHIPKTPNINDNILNMLVLIYFPLFCIFRITQRCVYYII